MGGGVFKCGRGNACHNCPEWVRIWDGIIGFSGFRSGGVINGTVGHCIEALQFIREKTFRKFQSISTYPKNPFRKMV